MVKRFSQIADGSDWARFPSIELGLGTNSELVPKCRAVAFHSHERRRFNQTAPIDARVSRAPDTRSRAKLRRRSPPRLETSWARPSP